MEDVFLALVERYGVALDVTDAGDEFLLGHPVFDAVHFESSFGEWLVWFQSFRKPPTSDHTLCFRRLKLVRLGIYVKRVTCHFPNDR